MRYCPGAEGIARIALRLPEDALGVAFMVAGVLEDHVVVAHHIEYLSVRVVDFPVAIPGTESLSNGTCLVMFVDGLLHLSGCIDHANVLTLYHLVADAPRDDAGVVAVAQHHCMDVLAEAGVDDGRIVIGILLCAPAIEGLVNNEHAYRVAGIEESSRGGIVRGADEVEARLLHLAYLTDLSCIKGHSAKHTVIVVDAGAIDEHLLSVEHETILGIERERADAIFCSCVVDDVASLLQFHFRLIERRIFGRP